MWLSCSELTRVWPCLVGRSLFVIFSTRKGQPDAGGCQDAGNPRSSDKQLLRCSARGNIYIYMYTDVIYIFKQLSILFISRVEKPELAYSCSCSTCILHLLRLAMAILLWLASMQTLRYGGRKIHMSKEAFLEEDIEGDTDRDGIDSTPRIFGVVVLDDVQVYHDMLQISQCEKRMVRFWEEISGKKMHGNSYIFKVISVFPLRTTALLQHLSASCCRSLMARLDADQGPSLRCQLQDERNGVDCLAGKPTPHAVLRLPLPFVSKIMTGQWSSILLPHFPNTEHGGSAVLSINWRLCGMSRDEIPQLHHHFLQDVGGKDMSLSVEVLDSAIDYLKAFAAGLDTPPEPEPAADDGMDDELLFQSQEFQSVRHCVIVLQRVLEGLDASAFVRAARDMTGKGSGLWSATRRPYQVAFLVKAVCMASLLRSASTMHEVLQSAAKMLLPEVMHNAFKTFLDTCQNHIPHASTISRWKMILDGSFMLYQRRMNAGASEAESPSGFVRFVMADASTQHS